MKLHVLRSEKNKEKVSEMLFLILTFTDKFVTLHSSADLIMPVSSSGSLCAAMGKEGSLFL